MGDDILQTFIPKSNNKMHEEDSFFFKQLLFKRIKITKVLFFINMDGMMLDLAAPAIH